MDIPKNIAIPFFAYGIFRPGEISYFQLKDVVEKHDIGKTKGVLLLRDGLPIIDPEEKGFVEGSLLTFKSTKAQDGYEIISQMEPDKHYCWHETKCNGKEANVLIGRSPKKGSTQCDETPWKSWADPLFNEALDVVKETLDSQAFSWSDMKPFFRIQMAYMLLWSSIERYVSLRYHLGKEVAQKVGQLAKEAEFASSLFRHVHRNHSVYRADRPQEKVVLDSKQPEKSVRYYYQIRSNITHRGKGVCQDFELVHKSLAELLPIFRDVLNAAQNDSC